MGLATTRAALLRGSHTDRYGDEVDDDTPVEQWGNFAASVIQKSRNVQDADTGTWRSVAYLVARVPFTLPVQDGDRFRDNRTGIVYAIDDGTVVPRGLAGTSSRSLELRQIDA
jgi:hypothetical protein